MCGNLEKARVYPLLFCERLVGSDLMPALGNRGRMPLPRHLRWAGGRHADVTVSCLACAVILVSHRALWIYWALIRRLRCLTARPAVFPSQSGGQVPVCQLPGQNFVYIFCKISGMHESTCALRYRYWAFCVFAHGQARDIEIGGFFLKSA